MAVKAEMIKEPACPGLAAVELYALATCTLRTVLTFFLFNQFLVGQVPLICLVLQGLFILRRLSGQRVQVVLSLSPLQFDSMDLFLESF